MLSNDPPETLREIEIRVRNNLSLSKAVRAKLCSSINRFADVVGIPAEHIPCNIDVIRRLMYKASPGAYGIQPGNWASIKSSVWRALSLCGIHVIRATGYEPTAEVTALVESLPEKLQLQLTPLLKFFSLTRTSPCTFVQTSVPVYRDWLQEHYSKTNWQRAFRRSVLAWNEARGSCPDRWRQVELVADFGHESWAKGWDRLGKLKAETDRHLADLRRGNSRRWVGTKQIFRESTIEAREGYIRRAAWAGALELGIEPETIDSLGFLTRPEVVDAIADFMERISGAERNGNTSQMLRHLNSIAKYWVKRPENELAELRNIRRSVSLPPGPSEKNTALLEKFRDEGLRLRFVEFPYQILQKLARKPILSPAEIKMGMLAFLGGFLMKIPLRIAEVMALQYGETLHDSGKGSNRRVLVSLAPDQVKNDIARTGVLGARLIRQLDVFTARIRPHLAPLSNPFLFPIADAKARSSDHISQCLAQLTTKHLGIRMTAHQWRHVVGYIFLVENPGCYETVRHFLGHKSLATTITYYAFMLADDANAALDETIDNLASRAGPKPKGRGPGPRSPWARK